MSSPVACSKPSTECCSTCSRLLLAKTTMIGGAGRLRVKPRQRLRAATRAVQKILSATTVLQPARGRPLVELHSGHDGLQPCDRCEGSQARKVDTETR